jgi:hypothetical protein
MPNTNIQSLNYSDDQSQIVSKLNNNFDEIVELHGGTQGTIGITGPRGAIGDIGNFGPTGISGGRGTRWFVSSSQPAGYAQEGDYWIDTNSSIYILESSGWNWTGYNIGNSSSLFNVSNYFYSGGTGSAIQLNQVIPQNYLFVLSDVTPESGVLNELLSKFSLSTNSSVNDSPLLEFSRSDIEDGSIADYSLHPVFYWPSAIPTENSLGLRIPGGAFNIGVSGGFEASFNSLTINSQKDTNIDYGATSGSGIFATGGYNVSAAGEFKITSKYMNISGGSGSILDPVQSVVTLPGTSPHVYVTPTGVTGIRSSRTGDTYSKLSPSVYHLSLESSSNREFWLSTKGKLRTNKVRESITYSSITPTATGSSGSTNPINWYFVSRTSATGGAYLTNGNTVIINPSGTTSTLVGIGLYNSADENWGTTGGLMMGQSIDITIHNSSDASGSINGFKYIGVGTGATASCVTKVTLPFYAKTVDLTVARGMTSGALTTVYYRAYAPWSYTGAVGSTGGSGGSFTY